MLPARYRALAAYALLQALMQFEWLRFAPVTDAAARHYNVSLSAIGNLALVFPLLFLPLALPAGILLDRMPVQRSLRICALGMALAALLRIVGPGYSWLLAGQILFALLQPLVLALVAPLATTWFDARERLLATEIPSMAIFVGLALAFVLVPVIGVSSQFWDAIVLGVLTLLIWIGVPADPALRSTPTHASGAWRRELLAMLRTPSILVLSAYFFLANGYFNAISTWLEPILGRHGITARDAGIVALCMLASGIIAMATMDRVSRWLSLRALLLIATLGSIAATLAFFGSASFALLVTAGIVLGTTLLAPLPVLIQAVVGNTDAAHAGTAASAFWLAGNAGAVVCLLALDPIADSDRWRLGAVLLLALLVVQGLVAVFGKIKPQDA
jgi:predicted MFS family arabinose efflux permease